MDQNNQLERPSLYDIVLKREWSYYTGSVLIVIFAMALCMVGSTWGVSGAFGNWGALLFNLFGVNTGADSVFKNTTLETYSFFGSQPALTDTWIMLGAAVACLLAAQWKIRNIKHYKPVEDQEHQALQAGSGRHRRRSSDGLRCQDGWWL